LDVHTLKQVTLKDYGIQYQGSNTFGQVKSGWIRLEAPLAFFASVKPPEQDSYGRTGDLFTFSGIQDTELEAMATFDLKEQFMENLRLLFLLRQDWATGDEVELFGIVIREVKDLSPEVRKNVPSRVKRSQIYTKVGFFILENWHEHDEIKLPLEKLVTEVVLI
jgi:hypothetical protein